MTKTICDEVKLREVANKYHFTLWRVLKAVEDATPVTLNISTDKWHFWIHFDPEYAFIQSNLAEGGEDAYIHGKLLPYGVEVDIYAGWITEVQPLQGKVACEVTNDVFTDDNGNPTLGTVVTCSWCNYQVEHPDMGSNAVRQCLNKLEDECEISDIDKKLPYDYYAVDQEEEEK
jgi:hypothetical protein